MTIPGSANPLLLKSAAAAGPVQIERSLRFNSSDSAFCSRVFSSAGNRTTWTWSGWVKRCNLAAQQTIFDGFVDGGNRTQLMFESDNTFRVLNQVSSSVTTNLITTPVYRDASAWYHVLVAWDTSQGTSSNRVKIYFNGSQVTAFATSTYPGSSENSFIDGANTHSIGRTGAFAEAYLSAYLADIHFISGQALTPSSFTEVSATTGQLVPKAYTGSFGTNGFKLTFSDNSNNTATTIGKDYSGNSNNWTPNNLSVTAGAGNDSLVDTPTSYGTGTSGGDVRGNFCTLNPLLTGNGSYSNGNLDSTFSSGSSIGYGQRQWGTIGVSSGKWYFEYVQTSGNSQGVGIKSTITADNLNNYAYIAGASKLDASGSSSSYGAAFTTNDVIGVAFDLDGGTITFYLNGTSQGQAFSGIPPATYFPYLLGWSGGNSGQSVNFGQRPFAYTAPSGFKALCDTNLPAPVVAKPSEVFQTVLWDGDGASTRTITVGFEPDLIWEKVRNNAYSHLWYDAVRGFGAYKAIGSNSTVAEGSFGDDSVYGYVSGTTSTGFSLVKGSTGAGYMNSSGYTQVAWCWDAGTSTVTNTQGSITSQVRANASAGFSVVTYTVGNNTSQTIGHGLNVAPQLIIVKERNQVNNWQVYHASLGNGSFLYLNATNTSASNNLWNNTSPTSTVFSIRSGGSANFYDGKDQVAYCFAPVSGYSSFGSYTGNGSADGPFVYTGFRPRWIMAKRTDTTGNWWIIDTARDLYNVSDKRLAANLSQQEFSGDTAGGLPIIFWDVLSNGFKARSAGGEWVNASGGTYIYAAFAENPFQYARAR